MKTPQRGISWLTPTAIVSLLVFAYFALATWNKMDWCGGWSRHYAATAVRMRAQSHELHRSLEEREELLIAAERHDIIAAKYARVAARPWLPYPKAPLITDADNTDVLQRTAAARGALAR